MERQKKQNLWKKFEIAFLIVCCMFMFVSSLFFGSLQFASAEETIYSNVLDDLAKDKEFNVEDYPVNEKDGSLNVIQIAESNSKELFVYVYQPSQKLKAKHVSMSIDEGENYFLYDLTFIHSSSVFFKYKLSNFTVSSEEIRNYNVASIYRDWTEEFDGETETEIEKAFKVGQTLKAVGFGIEATFEYENVEVVEISSKEAMNIVSLKNDFFSWMTAGENGYCSHVVAFSTELPIDQIFEAEVRAEYQYSSYVYNKYGIGTVPANRADDPYEKYVQLKYDDVASVSKHGKTYTFNRIMSVDAYLDALGDETKTYEEDMKKYQWVLCLSEAKDFFTYDYTGIGFGYSQIGGTLLQSASILKLKFDMGGIIYNLGVVDNISGANIKGNVEDNWLKSIANDITSFLKKSWRVLTIILIGIPVIIFTMWLINLIFKRNQ